MAARDKEGLRAEGWAETESDREEKEWEKRGDVHLTPRHAQCDPCSG